jgi:methionyl-tRNA formyltransferase
MGREGLLKVVLFALTGFGNTVLAALLQDTRVKVEAVFTVKYDAPFPYYQERQLIDLCLERQIACYHGVKVSSDAGIGLLRHHFPDLIIVATFKQILQANVINLPSLGVVNFHPSLLPLYRGPCPTNAALLNDDKITGVTVHYVTEKLDEGNILLQRSIAIGELVQDGELRRELAKLAGEMVPGVVALFADFTRPAGVPQDNSRASLAPKPTIDDGYLEFANDIPSIRRKMRGLNPLPGTSILVGGDRRVAVDRFETLQDNRADGIYENGPVIDVVLGFQGIRLYKKLGG